ncbi:Di-sulfide bridge nucleocytoplasmic transport domain-containing protein [Rhodofomes roseus]|nr:Di-sulfide bridge nucleocytoplasmic transport domain-containing protein [Rhodofomes roseus]KAH9836764.1 Di-sulfide bridge nucleocytoplasmic transport domain-containing protein [Rhodofomes roseus]
MDFEFTSRPSSFTKPAWASENEDPSTPRKRPFTDDNPPAPAFPTPSHVDSFPSFGHNTNVPFLFNEPIPQTPHTPAWTPPPNFSPTKAFPQPEIKDVDMADSSPIRLGEQLLQKGDEKEGEGERAVALGAVRRVYRSRQRARERSRARRGKSRGLDQEGSDVTDESDDDERGVVTQSTSNHYTLNMPGPAPPQSDLPYVLLGYLQFFFNLSLILVFLYLLVQFILTVQRDVEQRISEYSMEIVQEIAQCALQHKANLCASRPIPAMSHQCSVWETCMNRDPSKVGRARVGAELIAEVVNGFVEPISWKTLIFTLTSLAFLTVFINALLSLYRARINPATHPPPAHPPMPTFPIAPPVAYPQPHHYLSPPPEWSKSWSAAQDDVPQTPSRRRRLEGGLAEKIR